MDSTLQGMTDTDPHPVRLPDPRERPTLTIVEAGGILGLCKSSAYDAVHRGELPVIKIGRRLLVPTAALRRMLALDDEPRPAA